MMLVPKVIGVFLLIVAGMTVLAAWHFGMISVLAPWYEAIRRDQMLNSRSYEEGTLRALYEYKRQYDRAGSDAERDVLAAAARHEFSIFPRDRLPPDLLPFMDAVEGR